MQVRIYKPTKSTTQSGEAKNFWLLEFVKKPRSQFKENLMGRTSNNDMYSEVKMKFPSLESAMQFAKKQNYDFEIIK